MIECFLEVKSSDFRLYTSYRFSSHGDEFSEVCFDLLDDMNFRQIIDANSILDVIWIHKAYENDRLDEIRIEET